MTTLDEDLYEELAYELAERDEELFNESDDELIESLFLFENESGLSQKAVKKAIKLNRYYAFTRKTPKWGKHVKRLAKILGLSSTKADPSKASFAQAVARWQTQNGLSSSDGIIGCNTWAKIKTKHSIADDSLVTFGLPRTGLGFYSYRRPEKSFGRPQTIFAIMILGLFWGTKHPRIGIGEISYNGGGPICGHVSHQHGLDVDIRPIRNDGTEEPVVYKSPHYSRQLTQKLVDILRNKTGFKVKLILFNDPKIRGVQHWKNHDDHLHVRFIPV